MVHAATAQRIELGVTLGAVNYVGDVAPTMVLKETRPTGGIFARYNFNHTWAFALHANQLRIGGSDANFENLKSRNVQFRTDITEVAGVFEFNYFKYGAGVLDEHFTPYVFWGLGAAYYNPQGMYNGNWYSLREYQTEGKAYSGVTVVMPMGFGLKWMPSKKMSFECSVGFRKTYSDYLDDVSDKYLDINTQLETKGPIGAGLADPSIAPNAASYKNKKGLQRGNPDFNDFYFTANLTVTYRIFSRIKCARFY